MRALALLSDASCKCATTLRTHCNAIKEQSYWGLIPEIYNSDCVTILNFLYMDEHCVITKTICAALLLFLGLGLTPAENGRSRILISCRADITLGIYR